MSLPITKIPGVGVCRASYSGHGDLVFCLNEERFLCDYCLPFGETFYCRHPQCMEIAVRTETQKKRPSEDESK